MSFSVCVVPPRGAHSAVRLAGKELIHWLSAGHRRERFVRTTSMKGAEFILGTFEDLGGALGEELRNDRWVDEIVLRSIDGRLFLAGSNPRSVLFAVYTYLDDLGFAWVVPGRDGEIVPRLKDIPLGGYDIHHRPSLIHRGFALSGAFDAKMGEEFVEWMARNRFNHLFLEGVTRRRSYQQALRRRISIDL
jgi:hypothetical protein